MPSPFPGMDPYLEDPGLWPDVHHELISVIRERVGQSVRPKYHVRIEERVYISDENDPGRCVIVPDVSIHRDHHAGELQDLTLSESDVAISEPVVATTLIEDEIHEARVEIIDRDTRKVITVIEVPSPANKVMGSRGTESYREKREEVMRSSTHLVEIDFLRQGEVIFARESLPPFDYLVHVSTKGQRPKGLIWPILLTQQLPTISIPLKPEDGDTPLGLQAVLDTVYDGAGYDLDVDYGKPPKPELPEKYQHWASERLIGNARRRSNRGMAE